MRKGFTLIEILIVVAISAMLSAIALVYTGVARNQIALSVETAKVAGFILRAKDLAIATYNNVPATCGYGVSFDILNNTYSLFAYHPNGVPPCPDAGSVNNAPPPRRGQVTQGTWNVPLTNGVVMRSLTDSPVVVLFYPPAPATFISRDNGGSFIKQTSNVHLATVDGSASTTISINPAGQISF